MCEYHAQIGALEKCYNSKQLASLVFSMECIMDMSLSGLNGEPYKGARKTVEDPYWQLLQKSYK